jgi:FAD/FMN-containing dehydrogenase
MVTRRRVLGWAAAFTAGAGMDTRIARSGDKASADGALPADPLRGKIFYKGDAQYEPFRVASTWNARKPDRFPDAIVLPQSDADVIAAVKLARERGWQIGTRSGGHSWNAPHTRDGALLINLARMKELAVDPATRIAVVSPSWRGEAFNKVLREQHQLIFPAAHCVGVGLGGFVLSGGHGWNRQVFGLGCENLHALDVVTADGELIHADESHNSDYLWAARGAGPAFFGVAVRFYLQLHPFPTHMRSFVYVYPPEVIDEVIAWFDRTALLDYMEATLMRVSADGKPAYKIRAGAFGYSEERASAAAALFESCPVVNRAIVRQVNVPAILPSDVETPNELSPTGARYACDGAWVNASASAVYGLLKEEFARELPSSKSRIQMGGWRPKEKVLGDMAYSMTGAAYVSPTAVYYDPADDARCAAWVRRIVEGIRPVSIGSQVNDENTPANKGPYFSKEAAARLEKLRAKYDPGRRFLSFLA